MRIAPVVAMVALALTTLAPTASAASQAHSPCGYFEEGDGAWYNHCASAGNIKIVVDYRTEDGKVLCVGPGETFLGAVSRIQNAWYIGLRC
ncbi:DUF6355 family natural product biosynthesis protein [Allokutzneria sp. A3M-2-11 16]|uniref:DUF6355 family natural product biosynthesis protein n=1 Tax=Allokutzneria sp. A3M-2-11 16 TaxID=2962043 RepID=UPI0020B7D5D3|nr:DUF6355 family natural product biosynthesis protein [Allokutzneria sp. A3M-2-11 16]MCP3798045.1 DUF6355 family natural product biosynthesis protein [Allokutzneria sp. A3M-2-11 16]